MVRTLLILLLVSAAASSSGLSHETRWSVTGEGEDVVAVDCRDCEEELGIVIACEGKGKPAKVTVNAAASEKGADGAEASFTIVIGGDRVTRTARTVEFGMIGFTPVFSLAPDDPIVAALQAGQHQAKVAFNGRVASLNLKGARKALDSFKTQCGWTQDTSAKDVSAKDARGEDPISTAAFKCAGGTSIGAVFYENKVDLTLSDGRTLEVPQAISGSGARYANNDESFVFWNKGDTAFITEGPDETMTFKTCVAGK